MVKSNTDALGIIFPNAYDSLIPEMVTQRAMASIPFGGRYRMIDFVLSSFANAGISNVSIIVKQNYHSLMDHLGSGREWDLTRKRGGLVSALGVRPEEDITLAVAPRSECGALYRLERGGALRAFPAREASLC